MKGHKLECKKLGTKRTFENFGEKKKSNFVYNILRMTTIFLALLFLQLSSLLPEIMLWLETSILH